MSHDFEYMNYSIYLFKMSQLVSKIKSVFYRLSKPSGGNPWPKNLLAIQNQGRNDLEQWASSVSSVVLFAPAELKLRLTIKLRIHYRGATCLLHQSSQGIVQPSDQALKICYENAVEHLRLYETLYETGNLVYSWRTVHGPGWSYCHVLRVDIYSCSGDNVTPYSCPHLQEVLEPVNRCWRVVAHH